MEEAPFKKCQELCKELEIIEGEAAEIRLRPSTGPLDTMITQRETLPGEPRIELTDPDMCAYLQRELMTETLNKLARHFWLMTTQKSENILSLTEQMVQGREITITEMPGLHLVWVNGRICIKPLPKYLLSHDFWKYYLLSASSPIQQGQREELLRAARGFLRSYSYLIQHESDFRLATEPPRIHLIPEDISYTEFAAFIERCKFGDELVSPRYQVGELRLTRLNFWSKILLSKATYYHVKREYAAYFEQFYAPFLFVFGVFSAVISAIQVVLNVRTVLEPSDVWILFARVARGFALSTLFLVACVIAFLLLTLAVLVWRETMYAFKGLYREHRRTRTKKEMPQDQEKQKD
ncbi:uncharacterized protein F4822DRAFT_442359 [Hypoxylon trugodes]|uniref:uncharacterized protein n=1 Tax=Hypoxylon trugodes TaxID=326681 RepID=UPI0021919728|nr:uncharacterized protein F4822DRAFT_442359 [Hypoxylon trugodes]KAI1391344.1 hypothetical protein F4822DRAFT_442359 [Hypoxylon trugodes]